MSDPGLVLLAGLSVAVLVVIFGRILLTVLLVACLGLIFTGMFVVLSQISKLKTGG